MVTEHNHTLVFHNHHKNTQTPTPPPPPNPPPPPTPPSAPLSFSFHVQPQGYSSPLSHISPPPPNAQQHEQHEHYHHHHLQESQISIESNYIFEIVEPATQHWLFFLCLSFSLPGEGHKEEEAPPILYDLYFKMSIFWEFFFWNR